MREEAGELCCCMQVTCLLMNELFEEIGIHFDVLFPLAGNGRLFKNSGNGAGGFAGPAIDALVGIDVELLSGLEFFLALSGVNTVNWADVYTRSVFDADTRLGDDIGHSLSILPFKMYEEILIAVKIPHTVRKVAPYTTVTGQRHGDVFWSCVV